MACWECLLSPQCVFTEPNSFLGRNGASLRNMCTTHLLLLLLRRHTHMHRAHQTTNQTSGIWVLAVAWAPGQPGDTEEAATPQCELPSPVCAENESGRGFEKKKSIRCYDGVAGVLQINWHIMPSVVLTRDLWIFESKKKPNQGKYTQDATKLHGSAFVPHCRVGDKYVGSSRVKTGGDNIISQSDCQKRAFFLFFYFFIC